MILDAEGFKEDTKNRKKSKNIIESDSDSDSDSSDHKFLYKDEIKEIIHN